MSFLKSNPGYEIGDKVETWTAIYTIERIDYYAGGSCILTFLEDGSGWDCDREEENFPPIVEKHNQ